MHKISFQHGELKTYLNFRKQLTTVSRSHSIRKVTACSIPRFGLSDTQRGLSTLRNDT